MQRSRSALLWLTVLVGCAKHEKLGGVEVTLRFEPTTTAQCAIVYATGEGLHTQVPSNAIARETGDLKVAIGQTVEFGDSATLEAHGFDDPTCVGAWSDSSETVVVDFVRGKIILDGPTLILDGPGTVTMPDGGETDGGPASDAGSDGGMTDGGPVLPGCLGSGSCPAASVCQVAGSGVCQADGGCGYSDRAGSCGDGGTCTAGACVISFPFQPTNIPRDIPEPSVNGPVTLNCGDTLYDTETGAWTNLCAGQSAPQSFLVNQPGGAPVLRVLAVRGLDIASGGALILKGAQPLALAVLGNATVAGRIDASAVHELAGSGSPGNSCGQNAGSPGGAGFSAGGGGAGHRSDGERGGDDPVTAMTGGAKGRATGNIDLTPLRGGCFGGIGGIPGVANAAEGGGGGGAFQLTVAGTLSVTGKLLANGGGGRGGPAGKGGGGGGGSGGGILLEANSTALSGLARVLAMGGGGGGGAQNLLAGTDGEDGHSNEPTKAHGGSGGGSKAGDGGDGEEQGNGADRGEDATMDVANIGGGGGGGAAMGRIVIKGACTQTNGVHSGPDIPSSMCMNI